ncbi:MAG: DCC1-like thiol-disulfide oxidoreductase family protein [Pseudomonadota bacterium]
MFTQITHTQYAVFRVLFAAYLFVHFAYLSLFGAELFSHAGMLSDKALSPLSGVLPTLFAWVDTPVFVTGVLLSAAIAAVCLALDRGGRMAAGWMLFVLISLFTRNPLIANPALPYVGFMLLLHLFVPPVDRRADATATLTWRLPTHLFVAASVVLAVSYTYSGYTKLLSPGWVSGETLALVLDNPLARDWWLRELFLSLPDDILRGITWFILYVELLFAPLFLFGRLRFALWLAMLIVQFGFLLLLSFPDLTIGMLLFHLLTFDPRWIKARALGPSVLHYDGECGLCHGAIKFALREVKDTRLRFSAMQNEAGVDVDSVLSWRLVTDAGALAKSDALLALLQASGGYWRLAATLLDWVPRWLRDAVYDQVARYRRRLFEAPRSLCPILPPQLRERFVVS